MELRTAALILSICGLTIPTSGNNPNIGQVKQSPEVLQAYQVCETFERLLSENLDFGRAYEATFTSDRARRRAIAIPKSRRSMDTTEATSWIRKTAITRLKAIALPKMRL